MDKGSSTTLSAPPSQDCIRFIDVPPSRSTVISPEPITDKCTMAKKKIVKERWVCDICRVAAFEDFDEACRHEEICRKRQKAKEKEAVIVVNKDDDGDGDGVAGENKTPSVVPLIEPKKLDFEVSSSPERTKAVTKKPKPDAKKLPTNVCKFENCEICGHDKKEDEKICTKIITKTNASIERRRSSRQKQSKSTSAKTASPEVKIVKTTRKVEKSKKPKAPPAAIFLKKASGSNKMKTCTKASNRKKTSPTSTDNDKKETTALASIFQRKTDGENVNALGSAEKAILAEHRAAEIALQRHAKKAVEREKQRKRDEARRLRYEEKKRRKEEENTKTTISEESKRRKVINLAEEKCNSTCIDLTESPQKVTEKHRQLSKNSDDPSIHLKSIAPRFPNPSHVFDTSLSHDENEASRSSWYEEFIRTSKYQNGLDSIHQGDIPIYTGGSGTNAQSQSDNDQHTTSEQDIIYNSFSSLLHPCSPRPLDVDEASIETHKLWSDKYAMQTVPNDIHGDENKKTAEHLLKFIKSWKEHRQQVCEVRAAKAAKLRGVRKKKKRIKRDDYDDDLWMDDFDDEEGGICNIYLLTGPTGSGKTSLVHAAALTSQCTMIEINTATERGGKALKKALEESTQSLSDLASLKRGNSLDSAGGILNEGDNEEGETSQTSLVIFLIDEVDLLFESDGDAGFWQSLANLSKKAKCPIILTSASEPKALYNSSTFRYEHRHLVLPTPSECASKMCQIAKNEGMSWHQKHDPGATRQGLATIAKLCGCDLRRIMNEMHLYGLSQNQSIVPQIETMLPTETDRVETGKIIKLPTIYGVPSEPFPSHQYSVIPIQGCNFSSSKVIEVTIGGQLSPMTRILNDTTILIICPPCGIPSHVDSSGYRKDNLLESISTRYAPLRISFEMDNQFVHCCENLTSATDSHDESMGNPLFVSYNFHDDDGENNPAPTVKSDKDFMQLLDDAAGHLESNGSPKDIAQDTLAASCLHHVIDKEKESELLELSKHLENISDVCMLNDMTGEMSLPSLSGPMSDFELKPYDQALRISGWYEDDSYKGGADSFVTVPSRYERSLISDISLFSRGKATMLATTGPDVQVYEEGEEDDDSRLEITPQSNSDEDIFLPQMPIPHLSSLSRMVYGFDTNYSSIGNYRLDLPNVLSKKALSQKDLENTMEITLEVTCPILTEFAIKPSSDSFWVDYVPHLRNMAYIESILQKNFNEAIKAGLDADSGQRKRRLTRRSSPAERKHYFDEILEIQQHRREGDSEGEAIGEHLAKSKIWYKLDHRR